MEGMPSGNERRPGGSAIDLAELPAIVSALTAAVDLGVASIADRVESYLEGRNDPAPHGLGNLPTLCRDLSTLGEDYCRLTHALADLGPVRAAPVDLLQVLREALGPIAQNLSLPTGPLPTTTDPDRLVLALSGFLGAFPELSDPDSGAVIDVELNSPGWAVLVSIPGRTASPSDRSLLGEFRFPMPPGPAARLREEEIELTKYREALFQLGVRLHCGIGRPAGVNLRIELPA
jgi:hypothetical protein